MNIRGNSINGIPYFDEEEHVNHEQLDRIMKAVKSKNLPKEGAMKLFISMPMNGRSNEEIKKQMEELMVKFENSPLHDSSLLNSDFAELIDSVLDLGDKPGLYYLGESLKLMADAKLVIMADGWEKARGCLIEENAAKAYGIKVIYEIDDGFLS